MSLKKNALAEPWFVYIIRCKDGKLYTGITKNVERRIRQHDRGAGCRFTKYRHPVELVFSKKYKNRKLAAAKEVAIKRLTREQKFEFIDRNS